MATKRVAVVTGSNKGIGYGIVRVLSKSFQGDVLATARNVARGEAAIAELKKEGHEAKFYPLDITDPESVANLAKYLKKEYGGLDILVNNAGIAYKNASTAPFTEQASVTVKCNFHGTLNVCRQLFPLLRPHSRPSCIHDSMPGHRAYVTLCQAIVAYVTLCQAIVRHVTLCQAIGACDHIPGHVMFLCQANIRDSIPGHRAYMTLSQASVRQHASRDSIPGHVCDTMPGQAATRALCQASVRGDSIPGHDVTLCQANIHDSMPGQHAHVTLCQASVRRDSMPGQRRGVTLCQGNGANLRDSIPGQRAYVTLSQATYVALCQANIRDSMPGHREYVTLSQAIVRTPLCVRDSIPGHCAYVTLSQAIVTRLSQAIVRTRLYPRPLSMRTLSQASVRDATLSQATYVTLCQANIRTWRHRPASRRGLYARPSCVSDSVRPACVRDSIPCQRHVVTLCQASVRRGSMPGQRAPASRRVTLCQGIAASRDSMPRASMRRVTLCQGSIAQTLTTLSQASVRRGLSQAHVCGSARQTYVTLCQAIVSTRLHARPSSRHRLYPRPLCVARLYPRPLCDVTLSQAIVRTPSCVRDSIPGHRAYMTLSQASVHKGLYARPACVRDSIPGHVCDTMPGQRAYVALCQASVRKAAYVTDSMPGHRRKMTPCQAIGVVTLSQASGVTDVADGVHESKGWPSTAYGTSKIGVSVMSFILQRELDQQHKEDIVVNACCPGYVDTDMTSHKGPKTIDQGADTPAYLALLPPDVTSPRGEYVTERKVQTWV
ncbi:CBR1 [Acanthosepion pharaonis]|uniref:CBR1 n=1 Tax=Acanthosepion pharaonis TaxID=158019 RepID=A0A812B6N7_ACAPH|nr:CBR1 [Sepia pharaonis]